MNIEVIGSESNLAECRKKFGDRHDYLLNIGPRPGSHKSDTVIFDFVWSPLQWAHRTREITEAIFIDVSRNDLRFLAGQIDPSPCPIFGFAGLPGFLDRSILEVSLSKREDGPSLKQICGKLNTTFQAVNDRVGLVTPRIICMIINEAYFAAEDGTASREDIDLAMKTGTNYPFGPFEWCKRIGGSKVIALLRAMARENGDGRYKICPLLMREFSDDERAYLY